MSEEEDFFKQMQSIGVKPLQKTVKSNSDLAPLQFQVSFSEKRIAEDKNSLQRAPRSSRPKKISRDFEPDHSLDLHGYTLRQALDKLSFEVMQCHQKGYASMLVITGKGMNSEVQGGVLPSAVWDWLEYESPGFVATIEHAPSFLGGRGAILIFFFQ